MILLAKALATDLYNTLQCEQTSAVTSKEIAMERDIGRNVDREVQSSSSQSDICRSRGNRRLETVKYSRFGLPCDFLPRGRRWGSKCGISHKIWEISMAKVATI